MYSEQPTPGITTKGIEDLEIKPESHVLDSLFQHGDLRGDIVGPVKELNERLLQGCISEHPDSGRLLSR